MKQVLIAGGGLGGLAAAIACSRAGWEARVFERAGSVMEAGAGIQLGPNATSLIETWGLGKMLEQVAWYPEELIARSAEDGRTLGRLELGDAFTARYGGPYVTVHRADLHALLLQGAQVADRVRIFPGSTVSGFTESSGAIVLRTTDGAQMQGDALLGADGLWSVVREGLLHDGPARPTGHLAYRALVHKQYLPAGMRIRGIAVWLGARLHVVIYPVRGGDWLNVVAIVEGQAGGDATDWSQPAVAADLRRAMGNTCTELRDLIHAIDDWRLWALCDRAPLRGPQQMAQGRVALLGDAAHPMRPYLAQGAAMALEDASGLGRMLGMGELEVPAALRRYAQNRWQRNARVQARSRRNGQIFHAGGPLRWARDLAMKTLGERVMDLPWLYRN